MMTNPETSVRQALHDLNIAHTSFYETRPMVEYYILDPSAFDTDMSSATTKAEFGKVCRERLGSGDLRRKAEQLRECGELLPGF